MWITNYIKYIGIAHGIKWEDLPEDFACPCGGRDACGRCAHGIMRSCS